MKLREFFLFLMTLHWTFAAPGPVRNLSAFLERITGEVVLTWQAPQVTDSEVTRYIIRYWKIGVGDCEILTIPGPAFIEFVHFTITTKRLGVSFYIGLLCM